MAIRNIKMVVEYDGTAYHGWERQTNALGIQAVLEEALSKVTGEGVAATAAGRTDAGVHALGQVVSFKTSGSIPTNHIPDALNSILPGDIAVLSAEDVPMAFHARYSAKGKLYRYIINNSKYPSALNRFREYHYPYSLDFDAMHDAVQHFTGKHDFRAFLASGSSVENTVRAVTRMELSKRDDHIILEIAADGFLYHMVRNIVGTLLQVGHGKIRSEDIPGIIQSGDRKRAGETAPPHGLYLVEVYY